MRRFTGYFLLFLLIAACSDQQPQIRSLQPAAKVLAFGDSLTYGSGASREQTYPAVLAELTGLNVINAGVPGEVSAEGRKRLPDLLKVERPKLVILMHGGNDLLRRRDEAQLAGNLKAMVNTAKAEGADVVLVGMPRPRLFLLESAPLYAEVADAHNLPLETEILPELEADNAYKSDAIHLNAAGYRKLAEAVRDLLIESGALPGGDE